MRPYTIHLRRELQKSRKPGFPSRQSKYPSWFRSITFAFVCDSNAMRPARSTPREYERRKSRRISNYDDSTGPVERAAGVWKKCIKGMQIENDTKAEVDIHGAKGSIIRIPNFRKTSLANRRERHNRVYLTDGPFRTHREKQFSKCSERATGKGEDERLRCEGKTYLRGSGFPEELTRGGKGRWNACHLNEIFLHFWISVSAPCS